MTSFNVEFIYEVREGIEVRVRVSGKWYPACPPSRRGNPDNWTPGEGAAFEDIQVRDSKGKLLPIELQRELIDDEFFLRAIEACLDECSRSVLDM